MLYMFKFVVNYLLANHLFNIAVRIDTNYISMRIARNYISMRILKIIYYILYIQYLNNVPLQNIRFVKTFIPILVK